MKSKPSLIVGILLGAGAIVLLLIGVNRGGGGTGEADGGNPPRDGSGT